MRKIAWGAIFDQFIAEFKDENGVRDDKLTKEEAAGLKSLKKRVGDGSLVVVQTDKSSRFAIMSLEEYEAAGKKHTEKDQEVDMEFVKKNETKIKSHISMMLKIFMVGAAWGHEDRTRATKITHSVSVAPLYLLYKDNKGWTVDMGGCPPFRPVASAGSGQNDNFSEVASILLEPVANQWKGGMEVQSTPDMVSLVEELNEGDLELEDIDLQEVDRVLDEKDKILNGEIEEEHSEVNTLVRPRDTDGPGKIEKSAKQDMMALTNTLMGKLKLRWEISNPGANVVLDRVVGWEEVNTELRINLLGWLTTRTDDQILDDAMELVDAMENTAYTNTITKMG